MTELTTEARNAASASIDQLSAVEITEIMASEDAKVAAAVAAEKGQIAAAVQAIAEALARGGRLVYIGAGTSGRLGVLDASECPPTFNTPPELVIGIIAGGEAALTRAIEGAEDDSEQAEKDLQRHSLSQDDVLVGIATSGRTPYVLAALQYANQLGAVTVGVSCNAPSPMHPLCKIMISPIVGPEIISGSTRLKAGTATKMVLNMLTTGAMILLGKTYGNLMVDLRATNSKLKERSIRIVRTITGSSQEQAVEQLLQCNGEVKTAIVAQLRDLDATAARSMLAAVGGKLRSALEQ